MVREVIWSPLARNKRKQILKFWIEHNQSATFSLKLNQLFKEAELLIAKYPNIGKPTDIRNVRIKVVREYALFYELSQDKIYILTIWDSRQNPEKLSF